jgi:hypothetical protein
MGSLMALATEEPDPPVLAGPLAPVLTGLLRREPTERLTADEVEEGLRLVLAAEERSPVNRRPALPSQRRAPVAPQRAGSPPRPEPAAGAAAARALPNTLRRPEDLPQPPATAIRRANQPPAAAGRLPNARSAPVSPAPVLPPAIGPPPPPQQDEAAAAPEPDRPSRRSRAQIAVAGVAVVGLLAVGTAGYATWQGQDGNAKPPAQSVASTGTGGVGAGGFSPSICGRPAGPGLPQTPQAGAARIVNGWDVPSGYSNFTDPSGFHIAVPDGWTYQTIGTTICFRDPGSVRFLSVDPARNPAGDPVKACRNEAKRLVAQGELPAYKLVGLGKVPLQAKAADWEFTYNGDNGLPMHAMTRWFTADGKAFALGWATREFDWQVNLAVYSLLKSTFYVNQPTGKRATPKPSGTG